MERLSLPFSHPACVQGAILQRLIIFLTCSDKSYNAAAARHTIRASPVQNIRKKDIKIFNFQTGKTIQSSKVHTTVRCVRSEAVSYARLY